MDDDAKPDPFKAKAYRQRKNKVIKN
jgi:hypothetical protein